MSAQKPDGEIHTEGLTLESIPGTKFIHVTMLENLQKSAHKVAYDK